MIFCAEWYIDYVLAGLSSWVFPKIGHGCWCGFVHYLVVCCYMMYVHFVLALCVYITEWRRGMYESMILILC